MAGLIPLSHGSLEIKGLTPNKAKQFIGYVPQNNQINWNFPLSVKQVVEMGLTNKNTFNLFSNKKNSKTIQDSLSKVGLLEKIDENSIIVFDDIYWSDQMEEAWKEIVNNKRVTLSIDLFKMGIVFFHPSIVKEHYKLRKAIF